MIRALFNSRRRSLAFAAGVFCLLGAGSAGAAIYIYTNDFESKAQFSELKLAKGAACDEEYVKDQRVLRAEVQKDKLCGIKPPVTADSGQPDHEIIAQGRVIKSTPKAAKESAYLAVRVRAGDGEYYEFRISPKSKKYRLKREPTVAGLPLSGQSTEIKGIGKLNKLRLRITGDQITAFVNDQAIESFTDPNPNQVSGRTVAFGLGSTQNRDNGPKGTFERIRVGVPNP